MGGQAFAHLNTDSPIQVPRMSLETYQQVTTDATTKLKTLFNRVTTPREAPGKLDFGDIDILVEGMRDPNDKNIYKTIKELIGADYYVPSHHFALKHPSIPDAYVQIDIEISPGSGTDDGAALFEWTKFMKGDSDLVQIIGVIHRSLGLTMNDRGLHVRVEEVQAYNKKKSMIFLTRDPDEAMDFYGYDKTKYHQGFMNEMDLFDWATNGRWFYWKVYEDRDEVSKDRTRMIQRHMFRRFVKEYMPACGKGTVEPRTSEDEAGARDDDPLRKIVLEEALQTFNKRKEYEAVMMEHRTKGIEQALWLRINDSIPLQDASRGITLKGLKRWVAFEDGQPHVTTEPISGSQKLKWSDYVSNDSVVDVLAWIAEHREQIYKLEKERTDEAKKAAMKK